MQEFFNLRQEDEIKAEEKETALIGSRKRKESTLNSTSVSKKRWTTPSAGSSPPKTQELDAALAKRSGGLFVSLRLDYAEVQKVQPPSNHKEICLI